MRKRYTLLIGKLFYELSTWKKIGTFQVCIKMAVKGRSAL
jgi:hypothetical protein